MMETRSQKKEDKMARIPAASREGVPEAQRTTFDDLA
jgi:hypothetical protein